jgi:hypothetical protein
MFSITTILLSRRLIMSAARSMLGGARVRSLSDRLRHGATLVSAVSSAAVEGLRKAEQYYTLAHSSDRRGLSRAELLRFIMFVKH